MGKEKIRGRGKRQRQRWMPVALFHHLGNLCPAVWMGEAGIEPGSFHTMCVLN